MYKKNLVFLFIVFNLLFAPSNLFSKCGNKKINCLTEVIEKTWNKRDGGYVSIINMAIVELMILAPRETIEWIHSKKEIKEELISKWQILVFTNYAGDKKDELEKLRLSLMKSINSVKFNNNDLNQLKQRILDSLKSIKIREIN